MSKNTFENFNLKFNIFFSVNVLTIRIIIVKFIQRCHLFGVHDIPISTMGHLLTTLRFFLQQQIKKYKELATRIFSQRKKTYIHAESAYL